MLPVHKISLVLFVVVWSLSASGSMLSAAEQDMLASSKAPSSVSTQAHAPTTAASMDFDGRVLYLAALQTIRDNSLAFVDKESGQKWLSQWWDKHTTDTATPEGADQAVRDALKSLDSRFDYYLDKEGVEVEEHDLNPINKVGIGAMFCLRGWKDLLNALPAQPTTKELDFATMVSAEHPLLVDGLIDGSPAKLSGLKVGDVVTKIDGASVNGQDFTKLIDKTDGKEGSRLVITVKREGGKGKPVELSIAMVRRAFVEPVVTSEDVGEGITCVKLKDFMSKYAGEEMEKALRLAAKGKALILDLRNNGGGRTALALKICQQLLKEGTLLVLRERKDNTIVERQTIILPNQMIYRSSLNGKPPYSFASTFGPRADLLIPEDMPMVVLVNEHSASASEMLAGALQSHHRAIVVGKPSVGKGVGQLVCNLPYGRRLKVVNFKFFPGGEDIDWVGILPDVIVDQPAEADDDLQLAAARNVACELIGKKEFLVKQKEALRRVHEEKFRREQQSTSSK